MSVFLSGGSDQVWRDAFRGTVLVVDPFRRRVPAGMRDASGSGAASLPVPELGPGQAAPTYVVQALCVSPRGIGRLAAARPLALLDAAY